eukprot:3633947-Prymnesium_polylepis.1
MLSRTRAQVSASIAKARGLLDPLQKRGVAVPPEDAARLEQLDVQVRAHLPAIVDDDSDDSEYF